MSNESDPRELDCGDVALGFDPDEYKALEHVDPVEVGIDASLVQHGKQIESVIAVDRPIEAPLDGGLGTSDRRRYLLDLVVDDPDEDHMMIGMTRDERHLRLLREGWYPTRWKHSECGDLEMVVPDRLWVSHRGAIVGPDSALNAMLADGRTTFARDDEGNLIAVAPQKAKNRDEAEARILTDAEFEDSIQFIRRVKPNLLSVDVHNHYHTEGDCPSGCKVARIRGGVITRP